MDKEQIIRFLVLFVVLSYVVGLFFLFWFYPIVMCGVVVVSVAIWWIGLKNAKVVPPDDPNF